jgi:thiamine-monophosphate kinase
MHEAEIIALAQNFPRFHSLVELGIGDDAAVFKSVPEKLIWTTDLLIEDVHFRRAYFSPQDLAHKALAVNLSDIAAMAAEPLAYTLSLGFPPDLSDAWIQAFFAGLKMSSETWRVDLIGGDTTRSPLGIVISINVLGRSALPILQSGSRPGDYLMIRGDFGAAAAGLYCLERNIAGFLNLKQKILRPQPLLQEAQALAQLCEGERLSLTDASDGLGRSLQLLCGSTLGCLVELANLPVLPDLELLANQTQTDLWQWIIHGGEDYALLAALPPNCVQKAQKSGWTTIGRVTSDTRLFLQHANQAPFQLSARVGFQHF